MVRYLLVLVTVIVFPLSGLAQFVERGEYVEVAKGTKLCSNIVPETCKNVLDPEKVFLNVTSKARTNGT
ncbi:hypothetical protein [Petrachloros mirabilis]